MNTTVIFTNVGPEFVTVSALTAGNRIRYGGEEYVVAEVLPMAMLGGDVVIGINAAGVRIALYFNEGSSLVAILGGE